MLIANYAASLRRLSRDVKLLLVSIMLFNFALMGIFPVLFNLYLLRLGYGPAEIGSINGMYTLASALIALPAGLLAERIGCRRVMLLGAIALIVGICGSVIAGLLQGSFALLSVSAFCTGAGTVSFIVGCSPYMVAATAEEDRIFAFSVRAVIDGMFAFLGSLFGGLAPKWIASLAASTRNEATAFQLALLIAPIAILGMVALFLRMGDPDPNIDKVEPGDSPIPEPRGSSVILTVIIVSSIWLVARMGFGVIRPFYNVFLETSIGVNPAGIGAIIGVSQLGAMIGAALIPSVAAKLGLRKAIALFMVCTGIGVFVIGFSNGWILSAVGIVVGRTAFSMFFSSYLLFSQSVVPSHLRSRASGFLYLAAGIGLSVASAGGGFLIQYSGYRLVFSIGASLLAVAAIMLMIWKKGDIPPEEIQ